MGIVAFESAQSHQLDEFIGAGQPLSGRYAFELQTQFNVRRYGSPRQQAKLLKDHGPFLARAGDACAVELHLAGIRLDKTQKNIEKGTFAATRGADDTDKLAPGNIENCSY